MSISSQRQPLTPGRTESLGTVPSLDRVPGRLGEHHGSPSTGRKHASLGRHVSRKQLGQEGNTAVLAQGPPILTSGSDLPPQSQLFKPKDPEGAPEITKHTGGTLLATPGQHPGAEQQWQAMSSKKHLHPTSGPEPGIA